MKSDNNIFRLACLAGARAIERNQKLRLTYFLDDYMVASAEDHMISYAKAAQTLRDMADQFANTL